MNGNWNYGYDDLNRLCWSNQGGPPIGPVCPTAIYPNGNNSTGTQAYVYEFDRYGNRWQQALTNLTPRPSVLI